MVKGHSLGGGKESPCCLGSELSSPATPRSTYEGDKDMVPLMWEGQLMPRGHSGHAGTDMFRVPLMCGPAVCLQSILPVLSQLPRVSVTSQGILLMGVLSPILPKGNHRAQRQGDFFKFTKTPAWSAASCSCNPSLMSGGQRTATFCTGTWLNPCGN